MLFKEGAHIPIFLFLSWTFHEKYSQHLFPTKVISDLFQHLTSFVSSFHLVNRYLVILSHW